MLVNSFESPWKSDRSGYDDGQYPDAQADLSPVFGGPVFVLAAVGDYDQADYWPEYRYHRLEQTQQAGNHVVPSARRVENVIDLNVGQSLSHIASSMLLLASIIVLSVFAIIAVSSVQDLERMYASEARV